MTENGPTEDAGVPPQVAVMLDAGDDKFPLYFARQALRAARVELDVGQQFEHQNKPYIRGLGAAFGVERADVRPFHTLRYCGVLLVPRSLYTELRESKASYRDACDRLARWKAAQGAP